MMVGEVGVRILFTFAGGSGHADPLVPIAVAARAVGHSTAFAGRRSGLTLAETLGFTIFADGDATPGADRDVSPLLPLDMEREYAVLRDYYAGNEARHRAAAIVDLIGSWDPDLIVCDEVDFGAAIAAERCGLPQATVFVTASGTFIRPDVVTEPLNALRAAHGLRSEPELPLSSRYLAISPFPPSLRDPTSPLPANAVSIRHQPVVPPDGDGSGPGRVIDPARPTVYVTLGTVFNTESGDLFERVLAGLRERPIHVVVTVGRDVDPARFGRQPENLHIERYIPQSALLPHCDLVINHGGSGSVVGALAHGLPMVVIPMGADQSLNAARCEQLGVGVALDAVDATPETIGGAVADVLQEPSHREAAEALRDEIASLPGPETVVPLLERLEVADTGT